MHDLVTRGGIVVDGTNLPELVFDPPAGAGRFTQRARGDRDTAVGGQVAVEEGRHTGALAGRVLRA